MLMIFRIQIVFVSIFFVTKVVQAQNYTFNFTTNGRRVCLAETEVNINQPSVTIRLLDSASNSNEVVNIYKRALGSNSWSLLVSNLSAGTGSYLDLGVNIGEEWEYQIRRSGTWTYNGKDYDAIGYATATLNKDRSGYQGQMILLVANDVTTNLNSKYLRLKRELSGEGWYVNELIVPRSTNWDDGSAARNIRTQIINIYNAAPSNDKPKMVFILGHVPLPRSGSTNITAPDEHDENKGARGSDCYYADIDGVFTDSATYNPSGLATPLAINLPNDFKWDQDFFASNIEMAFGRVDFADITDYAMNEQTLTEQYLDRLSQYKNVAPGANMGDKSAFFFGYDNSNDGSYRSLPSISKSLNLYQNYTGTPHPQWVQNNGPFKIYMQNLLVPDVNDWNQYGMNATVFCSDQSYWGFGDVPQNNSIYSRIRALLGANSKCLMTIWTTTGINIFHQAGLGMPFALATKDIMNHNSINNILEKAPQDYDTESWWNRTHFAIYGDPSIRLYQIEPPSNVALIRSGNSVQINWTPSPDGNVIGYNIFKSPTEFGIFEKINSTLVTTNNFTLANYTNASWYMVRAVKSIETGAGKFLSASVGKFVQGLIVLPIRFTNFNAVKQQNSVTLNWTTGSTSLADQFNIQRSLNGTDWQTIGVIKGIVGKSFIFTDLLPTLSYNYYRIESIDNQGLKVLSDTKMVEFDPLPKQIKITRVVGSDGQFNIFSTKQIKSITVFNILGQMIQSQVNAQSTNLSISLKGKGKGIMVFIVALEDGQKLERKVLVE